jgi:hypothetical protein
VVQVLLQNVVPASGSVCDIQLGGTLGAYAHEITAKCTQIYVVILMAANADGGCGRVRCGHNILVQRIESVRNSTYRLN